jgi:hypothetical protein
MTTTALRNANQSLNINSTDLANLDAQLMGGFLCGLSASGDCHVLLALLHQQNVMR